MPEIKVLREPAPLPPVTGMVITLSHEEMVEIKIRYQRAHHAATAAFQEVVRRVHEVLK
jgi:hypothetical protein